MNLRLGNRNIETQSIKITKTSFNTLSKNPNDRTGALKGGTFPDFSTFLSQNIKIEGGPFVVIKNFRKKDSQCRKKLEGGQLGIFQHPVCRKTPRSHSVENTGRGTLCHRPVLYVTLKKRNNSFGQLP